MRALCFAGSAVKASVSINYVLAIALADSLSRTYLCTCSTVLALVANYISHDVNPPFYFPVRQKQADRELCVILFCLQVYFIINNRNIQVKNV